MTKSSRRFARWALGVVLALTLTHASTSSAQSRAIRVDTVLARGDFDGDGVRDSIVIESRPGTNEFMRPARAAVYLGTHRAPAWVSAWNDEDGGSIVVIRVVAIEAIGSLVALDLPEADFDGLTVLLIDDKGAHVVAQHGIDYGNGDFRLTRSGNTAILDAAPAEKVSWRGSSPIGHHACTPDQWNYLRAVFDRGRRRFVAVKQYCAAPTRQP